MFNNLTHAESAFRAAIQSGETAQATDAFDYVLNECIRRGRARSVWHEQAVTPESRDKALALARRFGLSIKTGE